MCESSNSGSTITEPFFNATDIYNRTSKIEMVETIAELVVIRHSCGISANTSQHAHILFSASSPSYHDD
jgi:hypothetical protein